MPIANKLASIVTAASILGLEACASTPGTPYLLPADVLQNAERALAPWNSDSAPGAAVAVSWNDKTVFARGAGMANLELGQPIAPDSVFQVASISKQFTSFATLLLASEGAIDLDADIRTYIPEMPKTAKVITVRHLLDHASGLRERNTLAAMAGWMADDIRTEAQLLSLVARQRGVNFDAGDRVEYSNTGYGLLAEIIARVSGETYQTFMQKRIFDALDMTQTRFPEDRHTIIPDRASSYYPAGDGFRNVIAVGEALGSTGLYTSAPDLLKWAENFETRRVGDERVFAMMEERFKAANGDDSTFAKGQELRFYHGLETWSHGGTDAGYRSFLLRVPGKDFEVAVLSNRTDFDKARFAFALVDIFLAADSDYKPEESEEWTIATPEQLAAYSGDYELQPGVVFSIRHEKGGLTFAMLGAPREGLEPLRQIGPREFLLNEKPEQALVFEGTVNGASPALGFRLGLDGTLKAPRVDLSPFDPKSVNLAEYSAHCDSAELAAHYDIGFDNQRLTAKHARLPDFDLTPYQEDVFAGQGPITKLAFVRDEEGGVSGFYASGPLAERVWFACSRDQ